MERDGVAATMRLSGEFDVACESIFAAAAGEALTEDTRELLVDLRDVSFIDSSGIEALCAARRDAERSGGSVVLRAPSAAVVRVLEVTGLDDVFRIEVASPDDR